METKKGHATLFSFLRRLAAALAEGRRESLDVLDDGRARLTIGYPSRAAALRAMQEEDALLAMCAEDAAAIAESAP